MDKYIISQTEIDQLKGTDKTHFLNPNAKRINKSLGDLTGLNGLGFHIIEVEPGCYTTEKHVHYYEEECIYILQGEATAIIGDEAFSVAQGDFVGYRAGGKAHTVKNTGKETLRCIVVGQRLEHDVADYVDLDKRIYRNQGMSWNLVDIEQILTPDAGEK